MSPYAFATFNPVFFSHFSANFGARGEAPEPAKRRDSPENYRKYTVAFLLCTYGALITFLVFPSAPPWFALNADRILFQIDHQIGVPVCATIFDWIQPYPFASFPSLHATYPWLISLYAIKIKRVKALPIFLIPLGIFLSAVYLGEHYIIDLLGGIAYSTLALFIAEKMIPRFSFRFTIPFFKRQLFRRNIE